MIKLVIALTFQLSTPATIVTYDYDTLTDCLKDREEKVAVLTKMNEQSIIIGYSALCKKQLPTLGNYIGIYQRLIDSHY